MAEDSGNDFNVSIDPKTMKPQANMDGGDVTTDMPHSGKLMKNICVKQGYPKWPNAISTFVYGELDKAPQEEIDPEMWNTFEKPFIRSAPDPAIMVPPAPLPPAAPYQVDSETPLTDPIGMIANLGKADMVPLPPVGIRVAAPAPKPKAVSFSKPAAASAAATPYSPPDSACHFGAAEFKMQNLPICFFRAWEGLFYDIQHYKQMPNRNLFRVFTNNTRIFYLAIWGLGIAIALILIFHHKR